MALASLWLDNGLPASTAALYETILCWTPADLENENRYHDVIQRVPHLPLLNYGIAAYQDAYKPAVLAELHTGLYNVIEDPGKQERPISHHAIRELYRSLNVLPSTANASCVLQIKIDRIDLPRPTDLVFLSEAGNPFMQSRGSRACGIIKMVDFVSRTRNREDCYVHVEVLSAKVKEMEDTFKARDLHMTLVGSIASQIRIFMGLQGGLTRGLPGKSTMPDELQDVILTKYVAPECQIPSSVDMFSAGLVDRIQEETQKPLNPSQQAAIVESLRFLSERRPPLILVGPPGCGKTHTLVSLLLCIMLAKPEQTVHICAPSNSATAEIAKRLVEVVRGVPSLNLMLSKISLVTKEEFIDGVNDLALVSSDHREERLENITIKWEQVMMDLRNCKSPSTDVGENPSPALVESRTHDRRVADCENALHVIATLRHDLDHAFQRQWAALDKVRDLLSLWLKRNRHHKPGVEAGIDEIEAASAILTAQPSWRVALSKEHWANRAMGRSTVFFSTVNSAARGTLRHMMSRQRLVIVDEATQASEAEMNILLHGALLGPIMVGDEQQLSATVLNPQLMSKGYRQSLFERLKLDGLSCHTLDVQYRMHPQISRWPSATFYEGKLKNGLNVSDPMRAPVWQRRARAFADPYLFIEVLGSERSDSMVRSKSNVREAGAACRIIDELAKALDVAPETSISVGIIAGYSAQVQLISAKLKNLSEEMDVPTSSAKLLYSTPGGKILVIDVNSIDGFQGQERDVIILCTTRSNKEGNIGFMADEKRLNVALTRARFCLRVLSSFDTFRRHGIWRDLIQDAEDRTLSRRADLLFDKLYSAEASQALRLMLPRDHAPRPAKKAVEVPISGGVRSEHPEINTISHANLRSEIEWSVDDLGLSWKVYISA